MDGDFIFTRFQEGVYLPVPSGVGQESFTRLSCRGCPTANTPGDEIAPWAAIANGITLLYAYCQDVQ